MGHLDRSRPTRNADAKTTHLNRWIVGKPGMDLGGAITALHDVAGVKPRAGAVLANDVLLTVSPEWFRPDDPSAHGTWSEDRLKVFEAEATAFLRKTFGKRVVAAVLHLDEATPHIQAVLVPIVKGGNSWKLSSKEMFGPSQLSQLQQDWEDRMRPHGVGPRQIGSKTRHVTLREYYGIVDEITYHDARKSIALTDPPVRGRIENDEAYQDRVKTWKQQEQKRLRNDLRPLAVEASKGRLFENERRSRSVVAGRLKESRDHTQELHRARQDDQKRLSEAYDALKLSKAQVDALRASPINAVAAMIEWDGPIPTKSNAIDLVMEGGGFDYRQAVAWLAQRFDPETAATAVREDALRHAVSDREAPTVWSKPETVKRRVIAQQLQALAAPGYRLTVMRQKPDGTNVGQNLGKSKDGSSERIWTATEIANMVPELTRHNLTGGHVYVTPIDPAAHHVLIDDLDGKRLDEMRREGYSPAAVLESSPGNFQAILKVATTAPKEAVNRWFRDLNRARGDDRITGLAHPFRLAGFENRKPKHQQPDGRFPFVRLVESVNTFCARAKAVVAQYALDDRRQHQMEVEAGRRPALLVDAERRPASQAAMSGLPRP